MAVKLISLFQSRRARREDSDMKKIFENKRYALFQSRRARREDSDSLSTPQGRTARCFNLDAREGRILTGRLRSERTAR